MTDITTQFDPILRNSNNFKEKTNCSNSNVGSIEQHGPHFPISTDSDIVTKVCKENFGKIRISITSNN